ncbi:MAG TPA: hypothetical protein VH142_09140 [Polyangiaceae bacterium]|nr:hypothetical protein [Polyangiaceae bacterium]
MKRRPMRSSLGSVIAFCLVGLAGCKHADAPAPEATPGDPASSASAASPAAATSEVHDEDYDLTVVPDGAYTTGKSGTVKIVLAAKGVYHVNDKYPYKFKVKDAPGVAFKGPVFTRDDVSIEEKRATMNVVFTPDSAGQKTIAGLFAFSVCSAEHCLVEKRDLTLDVSVN